MEKVAMAAVRYKFNGELDCIVFGKDLLTAMKLKISRLPQINLLFQKKKPIRHCIQKMFGN